MTMFFSQFFSRVSTVFVGAVAAVVLFSMAVPAEAVTCSSVCNQVRRACNHSAKGTYKAGKIQCDEELETCKSDCVANADTCLPDCDAAGLTPEELLQCQSDCINCDDNCDAARGQCRVDNKAARDGLRALCDGSRTNCDEVCVDPIDGGCVRVCTTAEHGCRADAKLKEGRCKKSCAKDDSRKKCIRSCRKTNNLDQQLCEDTATICYAGCAGLDLTPPVTVP